DTNLYDSALAMLSYPATWYLSSGFVTRREPLSAHPSVVPFQFFATADGHLALACPKEKFFVALVHAIGLPQVAEDPRFASFEARRGHRAELLAVLEARFATRTTADWLTALRGVVPIAPVRSLEEALDPGELEARGMLAAYAHPTLGEVRSVGLPLHVGEHQPAYRPGPGLGADGDEILAGVGYTPAEIDALRRDGAFGPQRPVAPQAPVG
ncbi:MAG TPA: CoA transferase, partial [Candidatus Limnocylindrales bacterium]|nr:CoA transferase [Candidatus Limnocylindrales bacterium]